MFLSLHAKGLLRHTITMTGEGLKSISKYIYIYIFFKNGCPFSALMTSSFKVYANEDAWTLLSHSESTSQEKT